MIVSSATPSGSPSQVKVCTIRSGRTSWKQPWKPNSTPVADRDVAPAAAGGGVPAVHGRRHAVRPDPAGEQLGVGVRPEQLRRGGHEVAGDPDDRHRRDPPRSASPSWPGSSCRARSCRLLVAASPRSPRRPAPPARRPGVGSGPRPAAGSARSTSSSGRRPPPPGAPGCGAPRRPRLTRPACSSTFRCLETACTLTSYGAASWPTVASPSVSRATRSRLVGSARAANTCDRASLMGPPVVNWLVDEP